MANREIRIYPDPILRQRCSPVGKVTPEIRKLIEDMADTMWAAPGVGLAAPQVGVLKRVIVVDISMGEDPSELISLVNPVITLFEGEEVGEEGCLSIPEVTEEVPRHRVVEVRGLNPEGKPSIVRAEGYKARILQHEIDHLDGILLIDRVGPVKRDLIERRLRKRAKALRL